MRQLADADRIRRFMRQLGAETDVGARVYFTGGATAVLLGWRETTIDVDIKIVPEHDVVFRVLPRLKESLQLNVELASPVDFIPDISMPSSRICIAIPRSTPHRSAAPAMSSWRQCHDLVHNLT